MADTDRDTGSQDRLQGTGDQIKGRAEQALGGITGDHAQQGKGMLDEARGTIQKGIGDAKDALDDADKNS